MHVYGSSYLHGMADFSKPHAIITEQNHLLVIFCFCLPDLQRGASSSKFLNYFAKQIVPVFDKVNCFILYLASFATWRHGCNIF